MSPRASRHLAPGARGQRWWLMGALSTAAVLVTLGHQRALEWGDSLVPVLVSLQRWTPFYWGQERLGMLVPLLAWPARDPLWNLLLQRAILAFAGLAALLLLARHVLARRDWPLAGALAVGALLLLAPAPWLFEYLADQPYGLSLALALAGLALAEPRPGEPAAAGAGPGPARRHPWRVAGGLLLVLLAHWVNAAIGVVLGALALARAIEDLMAGEVASAVAERLRVDAALLSVGLAAGQASLRLYPWLSGQSVQMVLGFLPPSAWPRAWLTLIHRALEGHTAWTVALGLTALAGLVVLSLPGFRPLRRPALARAATLAAAAVLYAGFSGSLRWLEMNAYHWRYQAPAMVLFHLAATSLLAAPLAATARLVGPAMRAALLAVPVIALATQGLPSLVRVRADLDGVAGRLTEDVLAARCDLVAGDYWTVWPAVWHVALVQRERRLDGPVYGLSYRCDPTVPFWRARPRAALRICRPRTEADEREAARMLPAYGLWPVEVLERRATVDVLGVTPGP